MHKRDTAAIVNFDCTYKVFEGAVVGGISYTLIEQDKQSDERNRLYNKSRCVAWTQRICCSDNGIYHCWTVTSNLTTLTAKLERRYLLIGTLVLQITTKLLAALAPNYTVLLVARVASAFSRALFWSLAAIVAVSLVSENRRGWAISIVFVQPRAAEN